MKTLKTYAPNIVILTSALALMIYALKVYSQSVTPAFTQDDQIRFLKANIAYTAALPAIKEWESVQRMALDRCGKDYHPEVGQDNTLRCVPQSANAANPQAPSTPEKSANTKQK